MSDEIERWLIEQRIAQRELTLEYLARGIMDGKESADKWLEEVTRPTIPENIILGEN